MRRVLTLLFAALCASPACAAPTAPSRIALEAPGLVTAEHAARISLALLTLRGVHAAIADPNTHLVVVEHDPAIPLAQLLKAVRGAGFAAEEYRVEKRFPKPIKLKGG